MTQIKEIYKCESCGNIVEVAHKGEGTLVCCGEPMKNMGENTNEGAKEKHIPIIEKTEGGVLVKVGAIEHPMTEEHHIEWIEVHTQNKVYKKYLKAGEKPQAIFKVDEEVLFVREYCNIHGLWRG